MPVVISDEPVLDAVDPRTVDTGAFAILIGMLTALVRHVSTPHLRITAVALVARLSVYTDDDTRLQVLKELLWLL